MWLDYSRTTGNPSSLLSQMLQLVCMLLALAFGGCNMHLHKDIYLSAYAKTDTQLKFFGDRLWALHT